MHPTRPIHAAEKRNFETLVAAVKADRACLISTFDAQQGKPAVLVCAVNFIPDESECFAFVPLAALCDGDPYSCFIPPIATTEDRDMTVHDKAWLEIEEIDESRDHYQTVDTPGGAVATFSGYDEARILVEQAHELLDPKQNGNPLEQWALNTLDTEPGMTLTLLHGRNDPKQRMEDWGFASQPIHGVAWVNLADFELLNVGFVSSTALEAAQLQTGWTIWEDLILQTHARGGLIEAAGCHYGDFELTARCPDENPRDHASRPAGHVRPMRGGS